MARARNIKPGFFKNEDLGTADPFVSLLFAGLWTLADKAGILEDRPLRIKAELFPYRENFDINCYLTVLVSFSLIHRYEVDGVKLIQITNFVKHQNPHHTEKKSEYPAYSDAYKQSVTQPLINGDAPADSLIPDSLIPDSKEKQKPEKPPAFVLPDWIDSEKWSLWLKTRRKKMIPEQMQAQVNKLAAWRASGLDYARSLSDAADAGWQGLREPPPARASPVQSIHEKRANTIAELTGANRNERTNERDITGEAFRVA